MWLISVLFCFLAKKIICSVDFIYIELFTRLSKFNILLLNTLFVLIGNVPYFEFTGLNNMYIYIVIHRQTVSFYQNSSVWLDT